MYLEEMIEVLSDTVELRIYAQSAEDMYDHDDDVLMYEYDGKNSIPECLDRCHVDYVDTGSRLEHGSAINVFIPIIRIFLAEQVTDCIELGCDYHEMLLDNYEMEWLDKLYQNKYFPYA